MYRSEMGRFVSSLCVWPSTQDFGTRVCVEVMTRLAGFIPLSEEFGVAGPVVKRKLSCAPAYMQLQRLVVLLVLSSAIFMNCCADSTSSGGDDQRCDGATAANETMDQSCESGCSCNLFQVQRQTGRKSAAASPKHPLDQHRAPRSTFQIFDGARGAVECTLIGLY